MILTETPRRKRVTKLVNWGHWFALINIVIAIVIASIYVVTSPPPGTLIGMLYLFSNWVSHMGFLTFMGFVVLILPLCYAIPNARLVKSISSVIAAFGLALLAFDALLYTKYGLHLTLGSADLIRSEAQTVMERLGWQQWGFFALMFLVWLSFQLIIANALWQRIERFQKYKLGMPISSFFVLCFVSSHAVHVWADANLYQPIVKQDDMFPLSYPATAKTLMSKYGLLDIQNYQQRKALQFDSRVAGLKYPTSPVYCGIAPTKPLLILIQTDREDMADAMAMGLSAFQSHYDISTDKHAAIYSTLFGLPELYHDALSAYTPLLLELPSKLGLPVILYSDQVINNEAISAFTQNWDSFRTSLENTTPKLAIAFVTAEQRKALLTKSLADSYQVILTSANTQQDGTYNASLYANLSLKAEVSSLEDIPATALDTLGCTASAENYSTGQSLLNPRRNWLVSTHGSKVVVLHNDLRSEVLNNGNYKVYERVSGEESVEPLNTGLLSQAMKHLSRFTQ